MKKLPKVSELKKKKKKKEGTPISIDKGKVKQIMIPRLSHTVKQLKTTVEHTPWTRNPEWKSGSSRQVGVFE